MCSTIFSSHTSQQRWADKLNDHFIVYVENPPSIFHVPKTILDTNPEAYSPEEIGIGPFHHFRRDLDNMESTKLAAIRSFLKPEQLHNFKSLVVDNVRALEPLIRSCYDKYMDLDSDTLAWAMAIDGVFLLQLLRKYKQPSISPNDRKLAQDVLKMENQFPCIVLNQIRNALFQPPKVASLEENCRENRDISMVDEEIEEYNDGKELLSEMLSFCRSHSPLDIRWQVQHEVIKHSYPRSSPHVLDLMYRLLVLKLTQGEPSSKVSSIVLPTVFPRPKDVAAELIGLKNPLELVASLPYQECFNLFRNANSSKKSSMEEIEIPSVSQFHQAPKIQFRKWNGIALNYNGKNGEKPTLCLPVISLNIESEAILRNLVAYESALGSNDNVVSGFVDLMCGLIDTAKDVDLLKEEGIIETGLPSGEVAKIFNGINKSSGMVDLVEQITQKMNEAYGGSFRVRCFRFVKNHLIPSEDSVKLVLWILLVSLLVLQAFCQIYGCSDHWFTSK